MLEHSRINFIKAYFLKVYVFEVLKHPSDPTFEQCVTFGTLSNAYKKIVYNFYHFISCYGLPLSIMIYCYAEIFSTITSHSKNKQKYNEVFNFGTSNVLRHKSSMKKKKPGCDPLVIANPETTTTAAAADHKRMFTMDVFKRGGVCKPNGGHELPSDEFESINYHNISLAIPSTKRHRPLRMSKFYSHFQFPTPQGESKPNNLISSSELMRRNTNKTYLKAKFRTLRLSILIGMIHKCDSFTVGTISF